MRAFLFTIWIKAGKSAVQTIELLEQLAAKQYSIAEQGGRYVVSATVQGKSFTYELPEDETPYDFIQLCYDAWRLVRGMTDQELEDFIVDADNEVTNVTQATFSKNAYQYQSPYGN
tara:strand:+ start:104 stop:451 length:348 start_codon:yes stop_codon:yes gene_type:complete